MGRLPRIQPSGIHYHVIARCNHKAFYFETEEDFENYLSTLRLFQKKHQFKLFNYELMNSHIHLFLEPSPEIPLSKTMRLINWKYANNYNRRRKRKGHFWMDRYKCIPVEADHHALGLMHYMNRNPLRAGMVQKPGEWKWSGYLFYAHGISNDLLTPHITYLALGKTDEERQEKYRNFVNMILFSEDKREPQWSESMFIGSEKFGRKFSKHLNKR